MDQTGATENTKTQLEEERVEPSFAFYDWMDCDEGDAVAEEKRSLDGGNHQKYAKDH